MQLVKRMNLIVDNDNDQRGLTAHISNVISEKSHTDKAFLPIYIIHV